MTTNVYNVNVTKNTLKFAFFLKQDEINTKCRHNHCECKFNTSSITHIEKLYIIN